LKTTIKTSKFCFVFFMTINCFSGPRFSLLVYATLLDSPAEVMSSLNEVGIAPRWKTTEALSLMFETKKGMVHRKCHR